MLGDFSSSLSDSMRSVRDDKEEKEEEEDDHVLVKRGWQNEKNAPELLPYLSSSVANLIELIHNQENVMHQLNESDSLDHLFLSIFYELEIERVKYTIRSYLEIRLTKIERAAHFLRSLEKDRLSVLLSTAELEHLNR